MDRREVMDLAKQSSEKAYAPYSRFAVGAIVVTEGGTLYKGCNVENASYGLSVCAERNAVAAMVQMAPEDRTIQSVAVFSPNASPCFPCGACRQVLREFNCMEVLVEDSEGEIVSYPFEEILPNSFGPEEL
ncbi:cytidine deaminase [soil metagenome]